MYSFFYFFVFYSIIPDFESCHDNDRKSLIHPFCGPFKVFSRIRNKDRRVRRLIGKKIMITEYDFTNETKNENNFELSSNNNENNNNSNNNNNNNNNNNDNNNHDDNYNNNNNNNNDNNNSRNI